VSVKPWSGELDEVEIEDDELLIARIHPVFLRRQALLQLY
jgi:hypothetical protein